VDRLYIDIDILYLLLRSSNGGVSLSEHERNRNNRKERLHSVACFLPSHSNLRAVALVALLEICVATIGCFEKCIINREVLGFLIVDSLQYSQNNVLAFSV
jgi:hypothetical protein